MRDHTRVGGGGDLGDRSSVACGHAAGTAVKWFELAMKPRGRSGRQRCMRQARRRCAQPVRGLGTAFAASLGVGTSVMDGLRIELRGGAEIDGFDMNSLRAQPMGATADCMECVPAEWGGPRQFPDLRVGVVPIHGALYTRRRGGPALTLALFAGAGALVYDPVGYGADDTPATEHALQLAPTTLVGGEVRMRWPGDKLGVVFGLGVRLIVASRRSMRGERFSSRSRVRRQPRRASANA